MKWTIIFIKNNFFSLYIWLQKNIADINLNIGLNTTMLDVFSFYFFCLIKNEF